MLDSFTIVTNGGIANGINYHLMRMIRNSIHLYNDSFTVDNMSAGDANIIAGFLFRNIDVIFDLYVNMEKTN